MLSLPEHVEDRLIGPSIAEHDEAVVSENFSEFSLHARGKLLEVGRRVPQPAYTKGPVRLVDSKLLAMDKRLRMFQIVIIGDDLDADADLLQGLLDEVIEIRGDDATEDLTFGELCQEQMGLAGPFGLELVADEVLLLDRRIE